MFKRLIIPLFVVAGTALSALCNTDTLHTALLKQALEAEKKGEYKLAAEIFNKAIRNAIGLKDTQKIIESYQTKGVLLSKMSQPDSALHALFGALSLAEKKGMLVQQAKLKKNIGAVYVEQKDYTTALHYYGQAKSVAQSAKDTLLTADLLNNIGLVIEVQGNAREGLKYYLNAYNLYKQLKNEQRIALAANNIAIVYKNQKDFKRAELYLKEALDITEKLGDTWTVAANYVNFGNALFGNGKKKEAIEYTLKAIQLSEKLPAWEIVSAAYHNLSDYAEKSGDYKTALAMFKKKQQYADSLLNRERLQQIAEIREKYQAEKREDTIKLLAQQREIQQLKIEQQSLAIAQQNLWWTFGSAFVILIAVSAFLIYHNRKQKEKAYYEANLLRKEAEKQSAIFEAERAERSRIARDMHDELGSGLSKIAILTAQIQNKSTENNDLAIQIENVSKTARNLVSNLSDLVWALNVGDTKLDFLLARMREFVYDYLEECGQEFNALFPEHVPDIEVSKDIQRNLYLCFKETVNNAVKHSKAQKIEIWVTYLNQTLTVQVHDNGIGFDVNHVRANGNGLRNLKNRMEAINGIFEMESQPNRGTRIKFTVHLPGGNA